MNIKKTRENLKRICYTLILSGLGVKDIINNIYLIKARSQGLRGQITP